MGRDAEMSIATSEPSDVTVPRPTAAWTVTAAVIDGEDVVVIEGGERPMALPRWCPHQQADLAAGAVFRGAVKCPHHGFMFDSKSGRGINCHFDVVARVVELVEGVWRFAATPSAAG